MFQASLDRLICSLQVEIESTVSMQAFSRIAPAAPIIADVITCAALFEVLTAGADGHLSFNRYDKYLSALVRYLGLVGLHYC